jgi:small neutral amino acid transporter SnatA (MarC family)
VNGAMLAVAAFAALNPFRTRLGLPGGGSGRARPIPLAVGAALGAATLVALAWLSGPMLRVLQVTQETFTIAAGLVGVLAGAWMLGFSEPADEPEARGWLAGVWPVAYPRIVSPETIAIAIALGARSGVPASAAALGAAVLMLAALGAIPLGSVPGRVLVWLGRLTSAALVLVGVWLMIEGIRDV